MTAYVPITAAEVDADSPDTSILRAKYRDNPLAMFEKSSGAPVLASGYVVEDMQGAASVNQAALKTALQQTSAAVLTAAVGNITLTGGQYSDLNTLGQTAPSSTGTAFKIQATNGAAYQSGITLYNASSGTETYYFQTRYIQASPPYNLGNGDIQLFIFAIIDSAGEVVGIDIAPDPSWANNGPTNTRPDLVREGKKYQRQIQLPDGTTISKGSSAFQDIILPKLSAANDREQWLDALRNPQFVEVELTQAIKNADMNIIPHPFMGNDLTGKTVVMIDPVGRITDDLALIHDMGGDVTDIVRNNLIIDNTAISGAMVPDGVMPVRARWK